MVEMNRGSHGATVEIVVLAIGDLNAHEQMYVFSEEGVDGQFDGPAQAVTFPLALKVEVGHQLRAFGDQSPDERHSFERLPAEVCPQIWVGFLKCFYCWEQSIGRGDGCGDEDPCDSSAAHQADVLLCESKFLSDGNQRRALKG